MSGFKTTSICAICYMTSCQKSESQDIAEICCHDGPIKPAFQTAAFHKTITPFT